MSGRVVHFEVPYDDADRARSFYADVFGWKINSIPEMQYDIVATGPADDRGMPAEPGYIGGGMGQRGDYMSKPVITIAVDDVKEALDRVRANGGTAISEPIPVGDMGIAAYFDDSEGNRMGLWQNLG
jgi:predicted enzyme related to lactoylglutathione lyase